jgi:hypothetical protein
MRFDVGAMCIHVKYYSKCSFDAMGIEGRTIPQIMTVKNLSLSSTTSAMYLSSCLTPTEIIEGVN